jgi:antitoxin component YwqK of YwqJK toxin-antitoxin module
MHRISAPVMALLFLLPASPARAMPPRTCTLNGEEVNLNNGHSTEGKTGIVRCTDESGKVVREEEYRNGVHEGHRMMIGWDGNKTVDTVNAKGNREGLSRKYNPAGKLVLEEHYKDGSDLGLMRKFNDQGKLIALAWYEGGEKARIEYTESGKISELRCGEKSYFAEDREPCGFGGKPSKVELVSSRGQVHRTVVYLNGKKLEQARLDEKGQVTESEKISGETRKKQEFFSDGKPRIEAEYRGHQLHGEEKEYHSSGKLLRVTRWEDGRMLNETQYYLTGERKARAERKKKGDTWYVARQLFHDNGRVKDEGVFAERTHMSRWEGFLVDRWAYEAPVGEHRSFFESGQPESVRSYGEDGKEEGLQKTFHANGRPSTEERFAAGVLKSRKAWDGSGKLVVDEEYFEDGSRINRVKGLGS